MSHLELPVVVPHGAQECVVLLSLVGFEAQISLQTLLLSLQTLRTFINITVTSVTWFLVTGRQIKLTRRSSVICSSSSLRLLKVDSRRRMLLSAVRRVWRRRRSSLSSADEPREWTVAANEAKRDWFGGGGASPATGSGSVVWSVRWLLSEADPPRRPSATKTSTLQLSARRQATSAEVRLSDQMVSHLVDAGIQLVFPVSHTHTHTGRKEKQ